MLVLSAFRKCFRYLMPHWQWWMLRKANAVLPGRASPHPDRHKEQSGKELRDTGYSNGKHRIVQDAIIYNKPICMKINVDAWSLHRSEITMRAVDGGHTARNAVMVRSCGKWLPLLSGSSIKWEMHPVFSVSESLSLLAKFTRVADFLKITCLHGLASLHIHNPLWCTNKWNEDHKEQRESEYLGLWSRCEFSTDETRFGQNKPVLVLSDHGAALCCLGVRLSSSFYDLAFSHAERFTGV